MNRFFVMAIAFVLVLGACGDDSGGSDPPPTTATPTTMASATTTEPTTIAPSTAPTTSHEDDGHEDDGHEDDGHEDDEMRPGEHFPPATGEVTTEIQVTMTEFAFDPAELDLTPGETVRFVLVNEGVIEHELRLTTAHRAAEHIEAGHEDHDDEGGHHEDMDIVVLVAAGETRVVEMTLPADASAIDQMACLIPGHYEAGMHGDVDF